MLKILIIVGVVVFVLSFIVLSIISSRPKMKREKIKIDEALENINSYLDKKKKNLFKSREYIKKAAYKELYKDLDLSNYDMFSLYEELEDLENHFNEEMEDEEVSKNKDVQSLKKKIRNVNNNLYASIKYYNDSINKYYKLKKKFPTNIVKILCGFKKFDKFELETKRTDEEIFN